MDEIKWICTLYINTQLQKIIWRCKPFVLFFSSLARALSLGIEASSATFSCMFPFSACRNTISGTHTHTKSKQTAPARRAMIDSIKSNCATGAHFKVNLSQHFDIFENKACQVYFRSSFQLLPQLKKKMSHWPKDFSSDEWKRALRIYAVSKTSSMSIHSNVREVMALQSAAVNHWDILGLPDSCIWCTVSTAESLFWILNRRLLVFTQLVVEF